MSSGFLRIPSPKANAPNKPNWDDWARPKCSKQRRPFGKVQSATDPPASLHVLVQVRSWQVMKIQVFPSTISAKYVREENQLRCSLWQYVALCQSPSRLCYLFFQNVSMISWDAIVYGHHFGTTSCWVPSLLENEFETWFKIRRLAGYCLFFHAKTWIYPRNAVPVTTRITFSIGNL